jgi:hypothetical protein
MDRRMLGGLLAAGGLVLLVLSLFADPIGIGNDEGFGTQQTIGTIVAGVALVAGLALMYVPVRGEVEPGAEE